MAGIAKSKIIGAGTFVAIVIALFVGFNQYRQKQALDEGLAKQNSAPRGEFKVPEGTYIDKIIGAQAQLNLSAEQLNQLKELQSGWKKESAPLVEEMRKLSDEMAQWLDAAGKQKKSLADIQGHAGPLSDATGRFRALRDQYNGKAMEILSPEQKKIYDELNIKSEMKK